MGFAKPTGNRLFLMRIGLPGQDPERDLGEVQAQRRTPGDRRLASSIWGRVGAWLEMAAGRERWVIALAGKAVPRQGHLHNPIVIHSPIGSNAPGGPVRQPSLGLISSCFSLSGKGTRGTARLAQARKIFRRVGLPHDREQMQLRSQDGGGIIQPENPAPGMLLADVHDRTHNHR
jgi:hypothetical protein